MFRGVFRLLIVAFGSMLVAKCVAVALNSGRGRQLAHRFGAEELATERGIELVQRYIRAIMGAVLTAITAIQERSAARAPGDAQRSWSEKVQTYGQILLGGGAVATMLSDFLGERERLRGTLSAHPGRAE